jgi:hypothetical protein
VLANTIGFEITFRSPAGLSLLPFLLSSMLSLLAAAVAYARQPHKRSSSSKQAEGKHVKYEFFGPPGPIQGA